MYMRNIKLLSILLLLAAAAGAQNLPCRWDELTASDWPRALERSARTCILPIGILEKHGPHAPIGSDLIQVREWAARATKKEYAVVFPDYFYGQINEAKHEPVAFALPETVVWELLESTCDEIARNGFDKIILVNVHGGNPEFLRYFIQTRLEKRHDYAVYYFQPEMDSTYKAGYARLHKSNPATDGHAGERETSVLLYMRPDLVKMDSATTESGADQKRWSVPGVYTAIWWYGSYPNHYAGEGAKATRELGKFVTDYMVGSLEKAIKAVKADTKTLELQKEYYDRVKEP